ncbi:MarR family winged helix-turn-helix transcriptional regulator [Rathayibacter soli]|uniref:MarR family winged helix-turn-helix transcriptional regulator n=1 Tax=Rathayibacter soli TaxID=3144168 RepID=UPI0027E3C40A|nr:MarR family transcriptional regulator [Glaciibacter superstes]
MAQGSLDSHLVIDGAVVDGAVIDGALVDGAVDGSAAELAGGLRTAVNRLGFHLRTPAARSGITPTRLSALVALRKGGPQRPGDIATWLGISAASMSRLTEALEVGRWVARSPDPSDRRAYLLSLTEHGNQALDDLRREGTSQLTADILSLTQQQRTALADALPVLIALADRHLSALAPTPSAPPVPE